MDSRYHQSRRKGRLAFQPRLEILAAVKNAFDDDGVFGDDEGDGGAALEAERAQAGQNIIVARPALRKVAQATAVFKQPANISIAVLSDACEAIKSYRSLICRSARGVKITRMFSVRQRNAWS